jgi:hypothetical protein
MGAPPGILAAIHGFAQHAKLVSIAHDGVDQHALAEPEWVRAGAERLDRPRDIGTDDHRQPDLDPWHAAAGEDVVEVHRSDGDPHSQLTRPGRRRRMVVSKLEDLGASVGRRQDRFHRLFPSMNQPGWVP